MLFIRVLTLAHMGSAGLRVPSRGHSQSGLTESAVVLDPEA